MARVVVGRGRTRVQSTQATAAAADHHARCRCGHRGHGRRACCHGRPAPVLGTATTAGLPPVVVAGRSTSTPAGRPVATLTATLSGAGRVVDDQRVRALRASLFVDGELSEDESGAGLQEGLEWHGGLDDLGLDFELPTDAVEHLEGEGAIVDGSAHIRELLAEVLKTAAVFVDAHVAESGCAELLGEEEFSARRVVVEVGVEAAPDGVGGGIRRDNDIKELALDRGKEPQDDGVVVVQPGGVTQTMLMAGLDVVDGVVPCEEETDELAPPGEVDGELEGDEAHDVG